MSKKKDAEFIARMGMPLPQCEHKTRPTKVEDSNGETVLECVKCFSFVE